MKKAKTKNATLQGIELTGKPYIHDGNTVVFIRDYKMPAEEFLRLMKDLKRQRDQRTTIEVNGGT